MNTCCKKCRTPLKFSYHRLVINDNSEWIGIQFTGWCPCCNKSVTWIEKYKFVETTFVKEI
ncbi:MAG: hypothetical protein J6T10_16705 [Methanobrevibacter sp.]|nr:hypothetical protein [Methanobrevibacter sp.]